MAKNNPELLTAVNNAIKKLKASGEWRLIYEKNLPGVSVPSSPPPVAWQDVLKMQPTGA